MGILNVPQRFSQRWIEHDVPGMESTEFHATFHEAATRGWSEGELRRLAAMWGSSGSRDGRDSEALMLPATGRDSNDPRCLRLRQRAAGGNRWAAGVFSNHDACGNSARGWGEVRLHCARLAAVRTAVRPPPAPAVWRGSDPMGGSRRHQSVGDRRWGRREGARGDREPSCGRARRVASAQDRFAGRRSPPCPAGDADGEPVSGGQVLVLTNVWADDEFSELVAECAGSDAELLILGRLQLDYLIEANRDLWVAMPSLLGVRELDDLVGGDALAASHFDLRRRVHSRRPSWRPRRTNVAARRWGVTGSPC